MRRVNEQGRPFLLYGPPAGLDSSGNLDPRPPDAAVVAALSAAAQSPCAKSRRGVVIYDRRTGSILSAGRNSPPKNFPCTNSSRCRELCNKLCEHAEQEALRLLAANHGSDLELLHVKAVDGELQVSGGPSCWQCSRAIARDERISAVWLYHEDGWRRYSTDEFHALTLAACDLAEVNQKFSVKPFTKTHRIMAQWMPIVNVAIIPLPLIIILQIQTGVSAPWIALQIAILILLVLLFVAGLLSHCHGNRRYKFLMDKASVSKSPKRILHLTDDEVAEIGMIKGPLFERTLRSGHIPTDDSEDNNVY